LSRENKRTCVAKGELLPCGAILFPVCGGGLWLMLISAQFFCLGVWGCNLVNKRVHTMQWELKTLLLKKNALVSSLVCSVFYGYFCVGNICLAHELVLVSPCWYEFL